MIQKYVKDRNITRFVKGYILHNLKGHSEFKILKGQESFRISPLTKSNAWGVFADKKSIFKKWFAPIALGSILGSYFAGISSFKGLTLLFATLAAVVSYQMFTSSRKDEALTIIQNPLLNFSPFFIGIFSSMMGIGGGNLSVPIMSYMGIEIRKAIGTSSALGIVIAVPGSIGFMISGQVVENLPDYSIGYVNILYAALIIPLTIFFVPIGVRLAHKFERSRLQAVFSLLLAITATKMFWDILSS